MKHFHMWKDCSKRKSTVFVETRKRFCVLGLTFLVAWLHLVGENNKADWPPKNSYHQQEMPTQLFLLRISQDLDPSFRNINSHNLISAIRICKTVEYSTLSTLRDFRLLLYYKWRNGGQERWNYLSTSW